MHLDVSGIGNSFTNGVRSQQLSKGKITSPKGNYPAPGIRTAKEINSTTFLNTNGLETLLHGTCNNGNCQARNEETEHMNFSMHTISFRRQPQSEMRRQ